MITHTENSIRRIMHKDTQNALQIVRRFPFERDWILHGVTVQNYVVNVKHKLLIRKHEMKDEVIYLL